MWPTQEVGIPKGSNPEQRVGPALDPDPVFLVLEVLPASPAGAPVGHVTGNPGGGTAVGEIIDGSAPRTENGEAPNEFCLLHLPPPGRHLYAEAFLRDLFQEGLDRAGPAPEPGPSPSFKDYFGRNGALLPTLSQGRGEIFTVVRFQEGGK